jgi:hypothetical protein
MNQNDEKLEKVNEFKEFLKGISDLIPVFDAFIHVVILSIVIVILVQQVKIQETVHGIETTHNQMIETSKKILDLNQQQLKNQSDILRKQDQMLINQANDKAQSILLKLEIDSIKSKIK